MPDLKFYPSAASRWLECTASVTVDTSGIIEKPRDYADRGSRLHEVAEQCLKTGSNVVVGEEMTQVDCDSVSSYVDLVRSREGDKFYEQWATYVKGSNCKIDTVVVNPPELEVIDYKAGYVFVDPEENAQLIIYALATLKKFEQLYDLTKVKLTIAQPAADNFNSWSPSMKELKEWDDKIKSTIKSIKAGDVEFKPSEERCRWCIAKSICPALRERVQMVAKADFTGALDLTYEEKLELVPLLREWCKGVESDAKSHMLSGEPIEGWKVVEGKKGNRSWKSENRTVEFLRKKWKLKVSEIYKPGTVLSPSAVEQLVKKDKKRDKKELADLIQLGTHGPPTIAPASDARKPLSKTELAARDFAGVSDEDPLE
jgi:hypothetical protein